MSRNTAQGAATTDVSYSSLPFWSERSTNATAINPNSEAEFPRLGSAVVSDYGPAGNVGRDCPSRTSTSPRHHPSKNSTLPPPVHHEEPPGDLLELSDEAPPGQSTLKTLQEHRGELKQLPIRARKWTDLDLKAIQKKVNNTEDFQKRVAEPSLLDDEDTPTAAQAGRLADAKVPVELKQKRKGKKGEKYYDLSPFVRY